MMAKIAFVTNTLSIVMGLGQTAAQVRLPRSSRYCFRNLMLISLCQVNPIAQVAVRISSAILEVGPVFCDMITKTV